MTFVSSSTRAGSKQNPSREPLESGPESVWLRSERDDVRDKVLVPVRQTLETLASTDGCEPSAANAAFSRNCATTPPSLPRNTDGTTSKPRAVPTVRLPTCARRWRSRVSPSREVTSDGRKQPTLRFPSPQG